MDPKILATHGRLRQVKDYICAQFCEEPPYIVDALKHSKEAGLRPIHVPQNVGKTLYLIGKLIRPKRILEIGTLGGYSTLWLGATLIAEGKLISIESNEYHAVIARENIQNAGMGDKIEVILGEAMEILKVLVAKGEAPFDLIFIDADKANYCSYLELCLQLSRSGTVILSDNLIPKRGDIGNPDMRDKEAHAIYAFNRLISGHPRLESIPLCTLVGESGTIDALGVSLVK